MKLFVLLLAFSIFTTGSIFSQEKKDKGNFIEYKNEFWDKIKSSSDEFSKSKNEDKKKPSFIMDYSNYKLPESVDEFTQYWHNKPISQGWTGTCWCFSGTSFFESEVKRIHKKEVKISEIFTVYWEYVEKARRFVREKGKSLVAEGSQANAVSRVWKEYGCVPSIAYSGLLPGQEYHDHHQMIDDINKYLEHVKSVNIWNEEQVLSNIKSILNSYLGTPPETFKYMGKTYNPMTFFENEVKLNLEDYVDIMSLMESDYWKNAVYDVPDNWWKCNDYINIPLDDFMSSLIKSVKNGYSVFIGGDVSESGYWAKKEVAMVPSYDIPSDYIDENARQFRFSNKSTTDDHGIHIVGYKESDNGIWFLIKDSGSGSRNGNNPGYYFYHEDYVKLKMMNFMVHKSAVEHILNKIKN